jgi:hypothetical protein
MTIKDPISIVLCGEAGQGIQTMEVFLTGLLKTAATKFLLARKVYVADLGP